MSPLLAEIDALLMPRTNHRHQILKRRNRAAARFRLGVSDGTRTRDHLDHNQELYLLSYAHRGGAAIRPQRQSSTGLPAFRSRPMAPPFV